MDDSSVAIHPDNKASADGWNGADGQHWVDHADTYDRSIAHHTPPLLAAAAIGEADRVLDVGCGSGHLSIEAARRAARGWATGIDLSRPLIADARARAARDGIQNVEFVLGDAQTYPLERGAFDVVISRTGTMFFADQTCAFANLAAATRPGGRLAVLVWQSIDTNEWFAEINDALDAGRTPLRPPAGAPGPFVFADPRHAREVLVTAGWTAIHIESHRGPMWFGPDVDTAFAFLSTQGFTNFRLAGLPETERERALEALRSTLCAHHTADGISYASAVWIIDAHHN
jgi:SAM-dependent methyltransferase